MARQNVVLTHVGTSIVGYRSPFTGQQGGDARARELLEGLRDGLSTHEATATGHDAPIAPLLERCDELAEQLPEETLRDASAELTSLTAIAERVGELDEVLLVATDTALGVIAARLVARMLARLHPKTSVDVEPIEGLQVRDARRFAATGLPNYVKYVQEAIRQRDPSWARVILNPTGGFKSVVPYATILATLNGIEAHYIHESSDALLTLQPMPIDYDMELIEEAAETLRWLDEREDGARGDELRERLDMESDQRMEESRFAPFLELFDEDTWLLSGLGAILLARCEAPTQPVHLSRKAWHDLESAPRDIQQIMREGLETLGNPDLRRSGLHRRYKLDRSDCECYGRKHAPHRIFFFVEDGEVRVIRIFHTSRDHETKDRLLHQGELMREKFGGWRPLEDALAEL